MSNTATLIDFKKSFKQIQQEATEAERQRMIDQGMEEISEQELKESLSYLGYKIDESGCFNYYNNLNASGSYLARAMSYTDIKSKQHWAHCEQAYSNRENQKKLQHIRQNSFAFIKGRIWEL